MEPPYRFHKEEDRKPSYIWSHVSVLFVLAASRVLGEMKDMHTPVDVLVPKTSVVETGYGILQATDVAKTVIPSDALSQQSIICGVVSQN